jgi:hypothetical protein
VGGYGPFVRAMKGFMVLGALVAALCPAARAAHGPRLASMPLPKQLLGADAAGLALASDSGISTNADAARHAGQGLTGSDLARTGRITGYTLDYVLPSTAVAGDFQRLLGVQTIAELYRSEPAAVKGLAFWRGVTTALGNGSSNGTTVDLSPFRARVGDGAYAFELRYRRSGQTLGFIGDVVFRHGKLLGAVFVTSRDNVGLRARTLHIAERLLKRMRRVSAGG